MWWYATSPARTNGTRCDRGSSTKSWNCCAASTLHRRRLRARRRRQQRIKTDNLVENLFRSPNSWKPRFGQGLKVEDPGGGRRAGPDGEDQDPIRNQSGARRQKVEHNAMAMPAIALLGQAARL